MKKVAFTLSLILTSLTFQAGPVERYFQYYQQKQQSKSFLKDTPIRTEYFFQRIDPENPEAGNFKQRFYIDESFARDANSPVFFYICGESTCRQSALFGAIRSYAKAFNARVKISVSGLRAPT